MDNRDPEKIFGEWLCSLVNNRTVKSAIHAKICSKYEEDYVLVMNLCNGFGYTTEISQSSIENAKERYKQFNKSLLEFSGLSDDKLREVSAQIDCNAEKLKQRWINILNNKGIKIIF